MSAIPRKISSVEHGLRDAQLHYDKQKQRCDVLEKKKREKERALDEIGERIKKLKARVSEIKNNKEYQAHLKEIATAEKERGSIEDEILISMESLDGAHRDLAAEEEKVKAEKEKVEIFRKQLAREVAEAERELEGLKAQRDKSVAQIDREAFELYLKVLESTGRLAVVEARGEVCQGCHMNIPPQLFVELKKGEKTIQCPQCSRILYWKGDIGPA